MPAYSNVDGGVLREGLSFIRDSLGNNDGEVQYEEVVALEKYAQRDDTSVYIAVYQYRDRDRKKTIINPLLSDRCGYGRTVFPSKAECATGKIGGLRDSTYLYLRFDAKTGELQNVFNTGFNTPGREWVDIMGSTKIDFNDLLKQRRQAAETLELTTDASSCKIKDVAGTEK